MIIIRIGGGLGNQMFQYALYLKLISLHKDVRIDDLHIKKHGNQHNGLELVDVFGCTYHEAELFDIYRLSDAQLTLWDRAKRKILKNRKRTHFIERNYEFHPELLEEDEIYLEGYWQSYLYFQDIRENILNEFRFKPFEDPENLALMQEIQGSNAISIHIRRGDYLDPANINMLGGICTKEYYEQAIQYIENKVDNPKWFLFTDDAAWCSQNFPQCKIVTCNLGKSSYRDMQLMCLCKHNIIANSSFSWWAAWLNINDDKIVIAPKKWKNSGDIPNICPSEWIRL